MARPEVPDTSVLISLIRSQTRWPAFLRRLSSGDVWLSSVVMAELYAGTRSSDESRILDKIVASVDARGRLVTPTAQEWIIAGRLMGRAIRLYGAVRPRDHLADILIVVSAARLKGTAVTANLRHFERWVQIAAASGLDVRAAPIETWD
jgi:predicted nucleic acid-binding protein